MKSPVFSIFIAIFITTFLSCKKDDTTPSFGKLITINYGETIDFAGEMTLTFYEIVQDNRCPCTADCETVGYVGIRLIGNISGSSFDCPFGENSYKVFNGYETNVLQILPQPCDINTSTSASDYKAKIIVNKVK